MMSRPVLEEPASGTRMSPDFLELNPPGAKPGNSEFVALMERGAPKVVTGAGLQRIGMPVGGLFCGTLYLAGDGRLWLWDIFNKAQVGILPSGRTFRGEHLRPTQGAAYVEPPDARELRVLEQGFALSVRTAEGEIRRTLDADPATGFSSVAFTGQYPVGTVAYEDPAFPARVRLEAYSPFIPLDVDDSSLPATIFDFEVTNAGPDALEITLSGHLENAVLHDNRASGIAWQNQAAAAPGLSFLHCSASVPLPEAACRPDIPFEDWSAGAYEEAGWTVEGEAFGRGPLSKNEITPHQGDMGGDTGRVINSYTSAPGEIMSEKDGGTGQLTSRSFVVERHYINMWISGGNYPETVGVNLLIDGKKVRSLTGINNNRLAMRSFDVREFLGREAVLEIVDRETRGWGWIGMGRIWFSDEMAKPERPDQLPDFGTMGLGLLGRPAEVPPAGGRAEAGEKLVGSLGRATRVAPGESVRISFVLAWHFPNLRSILDGGLRHYAARFSNALEVARYVADHYHRLSRETRLWRDTWYDSTLPHWFLDRTFANASILATTTCHRFDDGRFWAWEGIGSCAGTCTHVWHYAQAPARLFPEIERRHREEVDFGLALQADGAMQHRCELGNPRVTDASMFAVDGQAGRILGAYREHQTAPDDTFLRGAWPKVRRALQYLIDRDARRDGILEGPMHNTLDADWYGVVPWFCGLYHAALRAGELMAGEAGDREFAQTCQAILQRAPAALDALCWREEYQYYIHLPDPAHPEEVGAYDGCHIDQVLGESWARQLGLGPVMTPSHVRSALRSIWNYNFVPDVGPYRAARPEGRWYALEGEGGLLMVTFPFGREPKASGHGAWSTSYFNECMSGFEHQVAGHLIWEGMTGEGLAVTKAIHDRYDAARRNPYNEIECSDHYARAMASYGTFLAACGFEHHNPRGHMGFAPRIHPENFRAAFTAAEGWGTYAQNLESGLFRASITLRWGMLRLKTLSLAEERPLAFRVALDGAPREAGAAVHDGRTILAFPEEILLRSGSTLTIEGAPDPA